jgi:hypothetical protein
MEKDGVVEQGELYQMKAATTEKASKRETNDFCFQQLWRHDILQKTRWGCSCVRV